MSRWDIARVSRPCQRSLCGHTIGAGEQFRKMTAVDYAYCADCAKHATGEAPPAQMPVQTFASRLERFKPADASMVPLADLARRPLDDIVAKVRQDRIPGEDDDQ